MKTTEHHTAVVVEPIVVDATFELATDICPFCDRVITAVDNKFSFHGPGGDESLICKGSKSKVR